MYNITEFQEKNFLEMKLFIFLKYVSTIVRCFQANNVSETKNLKCFLIVISVVISTGMGDSRLTTCLKQKILNAF